MASTTPETHTTSTDEVKSTTERYYVSDSSEFSAYKYCLPADDKERERLNVQSELINLTFDNKLIWAPATLEQGAIVVDSGTGSGHWLLSLAKEVPSTVILRGIDISPRMFPPPTSIPPNASFIPISVTSLPEDWSNTVALIHQRLLLIALQAEQWKAAVSEMYRVLAPGGWVQLFEPKDRFESPDAAIHNHKLVSIRDKLSVEIRHIVVDIVNRLPKWLEEAGFTNLTIQKRGMPIGSWGGEYGALGLKTSMGALEAIKPLVMKEALVPSEEEFDALVADLTQRCEDTPETYFQFWVFTAQKPLAST